ncbi:hypothetical protein J7T55_014096 [Diaporthe amygdali]|uniref:uncharacterized protein n=1 Tax=Phomopsis amygdali TaxID=1214568 RepID=UPI0022FE0EF7|nr:uncharacterized protein J7T55_014096 [Diaporthe amygdali]KAJ0109534.1 hypothetical protein J7T55_014096 [Diaporthe amygdali]
MKTLAILASALFAAQSGCSQEDVSFLDSLGSSFGIAGNAAFDYVVVGAGTSGSTIAARLAEDSDITVAVVEAGGFYQIENGNRSVVPGYSVFNFDILSAPVTDWGIISSPQSGLNDRQVQYSRGQAFGGSSAINFLVFHRPTRGSMDLWAEEVGDDSYKWDTVLPYFKKSATFTPPDPATFPANATPSFNESAFDNSLGGPLQISYGGYTPEALVPFLNGFNDIGIGPAEDFNSGDLLGANWVTNNINPENNHRSSSQTAFINPSIANASITLYPNTLARRVVFDGTTATGVEVTTGRATYTLSARKEVILSAGAFQSPQLLMVSGVGPEARLTELGIPRVHALEGVGQNLQDHPIFTVSQALNIPTSSQWNSFSAAGYAEAEAQYVSNRTGPLSQNKAVIGWEKLPNRDGLSDATKTALDALPDDWPELEMRVSPYYLGVTKPDPAAQFTTVFGTIISPLSKGSINIVSNSTEDLPVVDLAYFSDQGDMEQAIAALKRIRDLYASSSLTSLLDGPEFVPGPNVTADADIENYIRENTGTIFNAAGTTKMGKADDAMAVVDPQCRVYGVQGLRVVDTGSFPFVPPGHAQSTAYMLAEKIADDIKNGN